MHGDRMSASGVECRHRVTVLSDAESIRAAVIISCVPAAFVTGRFVVDGNRNAMLF